MQEVRSHDNLIRLTRQSYRYNTRLIMTIHSVIYMNNALAKGILMSLADGLYKARYLDLLFL